TRRRGDLAARGREDAPPRPRSEETLLFDNGVGGFSADGREYVIRRGGTSATRPRGEAPVPPAPWINVIANAACGFLVSERGAGYTWAGNSQMNRLTPWQNDPVSDPSSEIIYLRDETTGEVWTCPTQAEGVCRHGQGYTVFEQQSHGLSH